MKIELKNPIHSGFYGCSILNPGEEGNGIMDNMYYGDNEELGGYLDKNEIEIEYNYKEYEEEVTKAVNDYFIEKINDIIYNLFNIEELFKNKTDDVLISPRFYNFETDKSYFMVDVDRYQYERFINLVFKKYYQELEKMIISRHSSYDGFCSFYSNDIQEWYKDRKKLDYNHLETIFKTLIDISNEEEDIFYALYDICQDIFFETGFYYEDPEGNTFSFYELKEKINVTGGMI